MDVNTEVGTGPLAKAPRKPRPSELAAKKKKAGKSKPKTKAKKVTKPAKKKAGKSKPKAKPATVARSERLDLRLTKAEKTKVATKAAKLRRTVTSIVLEAIEKIK